MPEIQPVSRIIEITPFKNNERSQQEYSQNQEGDKSDKDEKPKEPGKGENIDVTI